MRTAPRKGDLFVATCPRCGAEKLLRRNPRGQRHRLCHACLIATRDYQHPGRFVLPPEGVARYQAGESSTTLGAEYGVTGGTILSALRRQGIPVRDASAAQRLVGTAALQRGRAAMRESGELFRRMSAGRQGIALEAWDGFAVEERRRVYASNEWREWREAVFARDDFTCVLCGRRGRGRLEPHHIRRRVDHPELTFAVDNGVTLCAPCHREVTNHEEAFEERFTAHVRRS